MTCLRAARAQGALPDFDQALQECLVPLPLLRLALLHKHHQVRSNSSNNGSSCSRIVRSKSTSIDEYFKLAKKASKSFRE